MALPCDCHFDFQEATPCTYDLVAGLTPARPQKIEDSLASMRSDLLRIITRWEQSGQGEGGRDEEEVPGAGGSVGEEEDDVESFAGTSLATSTETNHNEASSLLLSTPANIGCLRQRPAQALSSQASFLSGRPSYLLYFWEVADSQQLLQSSLQRLSNHVGATDGASLTSTTSDSRDGAGSSSCHRDQQSDLLQKEASVLLSLAESLRESADCQRQMVTQRAVDRDHEQRMEERRQHSEAISESCERTFERQAELVDQAHQYRRLNAELNPSDDNSKRLSNFYFNECQLLQEEIDALNADNERG